MIIYSDDNEETLAEVICTLANDNINAKILVLSPTLRHSNIVDTIVTIRLDSHIQNLIFMPIGDSDRVKGLRPNHIVVNKYYMMPKDILNPVIHAFMVASPDPIKRIKEFKELKRNG